MSRCFPYPPPGHKLSRAGTDVALIESIKLQRAREQAKAERKKDRKRGKKEKRKEKKQKAYMKSSDFSHDQKVDKVEKGWTGQKDGLLQCVREENEQSEKSSLTEEHELPIHLQNPSFSSDSTQNSNKRKRHTSPAIVKQEGHVSRDGNVIRIRLSSQKQQVADTDLLREVPCYTSGRTDLPAHQKHKITPEVVLDKILPSPQVTNGVLPCRTDGEQICSTSEKPEVVIEENASTSGCKKHEKKLQRQESRYKHLMENWAPPSLQTAELDFDDEDWLLTRKNPEKQVEKKLKASQDASSCSRSALWPRAQLFPDADIYALPFTVPF